MVIALFALSLVMIVGGVAAVVQGFPYVRLESGLAMVIGGATAASAGAVLLGIAAAILQMKRLATVLGQGDGAGYAPTPARTGSTAPAFEEAPPVSPEPQPGAAGAAGLAGVSLGAMGDLLGKDTRPSAIEPRPDRAVEVEPPLAEPPLPDLLPPAVPAPVALPVPGEPISPDEDLFAAPDDRPGGAAKAAVQEPETPDPAQEEFALRPAFDEPAIAVDAEPAAAPSPPEEDKPKTEELQVVGTYSSGANTYVMFANGTIEADTPRGRFTFQSLDELKAFVDSGGETSTRGAA